MRRRGKRALAAMLLVATVTTGFTATTPSPAGAAPPRNDSMNEPIYFVPGYTDAEGHDCRYDYWGPMMDALTRWGWTGHYNLVGYYRNDTNCDDQVLRGNRDTNLWEIGRLLAWEIYNEYSYRGWSVDAVGHSMGGLVIRAAIYGSTQGWSGWPPYIYVEDVVTFSTPHAGIYPAQYLGCNASAPVFETWTQCDQMKEGSDFILSVGQNPSSAQGTDWSLFGFQDDDIVSLDSAIGMSAGHKVKWSYGPFEHNNQHKVHGGSHLHWYWNYHDPNWWYEDRTGAAPVRSAWGSLRYWWRW